MTTTCVCVCVYCEFRWAVVGSGGAAAVLMVGEMISFDFQYFELTVIQISNQIFSLQRVVETIRRVFQNSSAIEGLVCVVALLFDELLLGSRECNDKYLIFVTQ